MKNAIGKAKRIMALVLVLTMTLTTLDGYAPGWFTAFAEKAGAEEQPQDSFASGQDEASGDEAPVKEETPKQEKAAPVAEEAPKQEEAAPEDDALEDGIDAGEEPSDPEADEVLAPAA